MQQFRLCLFFIIICPFVKGQTITVQNGDPRYQNQVFWEGDTLGRWELKPELSKGSYWVVKQSVCDVDTLQYAEFVEDGVKHGTWTTWEGGLCFSMLNEESDEETEWLRSEYKEILNQTVYSYGYLISHFWTFYDSGKARVRMFYPKGATAVNQWNREELWSEKNTLMRVLEIDDRGGSLEKDYYELGQLRFFGSYNAKNESVEPSKYYHKNGQVMAEGEYGNITLLQTQRGKWSYWNENGKLIAKAWFKNGEIRRSKVYKGVSQTIYEINQLLFSQWSD